MGTKEGQEPRRAACKEASTEVKQAREQAGRGCRARPFFFSFFFSLHLLIYAMEKTLESNKNLPWMLLGVPLEIERPGSALVVETLGQPAAAAPADARRNHPCFLF